MARHRLITIYHGDWDLFAEMKRNGYVSDQYDYTNPKATVGNVYLAKEAGEEFISVAVNLVKRVNFRVKGSLRYAYYRRMYRLTPEGWAYFKGVLMEESF